MTEILCDRDDLESALLIFLNNEIEVLDLSNSMCKSQDLVIHCSSIIWHVHIQIGEK